MRGGSFLKRPLPHLSDEDRMKGAMNDEHLSNVCRDIEARLTAEGAGVEQWQDYEELRETYVTRMFAASRAG